STPHLTHSLVTALNGRGRGEVVLAAREGEDRIVVAFGCDVVEGGREVAGQVCGDDSGGEDFLAGFRERPGRDEVEGEPELALGLLSGSLVLCGDEAPPALSYWLERTVGLGFRPRPVGAVLEDDPSSATHEETVAYAGAVLDACPDWVD